MVNGIMTGRVDVASGGTLSGNGVVAGDVLVQAGGKLVAGYQGRDTLDVTGTLTLGTNSAYEVTLNGTNATVNFGQLNASGAINFQANAALNVTLGYVPNYFETYTLLKGASSISGSFEGKPDNSTFLVTYGTKSYLFRIDYDAGAGHDILLTQVPRPGTVLIVK